MHHLNVRKVSVFFSYFETFMVKTFCFTEIFFSIIYVLFGYLFTTYLNLGIEGVVFGYFIMYVLYFIVMYLFVWKKIDYLQEEKKL